MHRRDIVLTHDQGLTLIALMDKKTCRKVATQAGLPDQLRKMASAHVIIYMMQGWRIRFWQFVLEKTGRDIPILGG